MNILILNIPFKAFNITLQGTPGYDLVNVHLTCLLLEGISIHPHTP